MPKGPIELLDSLVRGFILAIYDFVRLTLVGLFLPFLRNSGRVWPPVLATGKRFSTLTYLVLWVFIVVASLLGDKDVLSKYLGLSASGNSPLEVPALIAVALLMAMFSDLAVRSVGLMMKSGIRRQLYESVARIAIANIFVGILVVIIVADISDYLNPRMFGGAFFTFVSLSRLANWPLHSYLALFGVSLAIVLIKALSIRQWKYKILIGVPAALFSPAIFLISTFWLLMGVAQFANYLVPPKKVQLNQKFVRCSCSDGKTHLSGLIKLEGAEAFAVQPRDFAILLPKDTPLQWYDNSPALSLSVMHSNGSAFTELLKLDNEELLSWAPSSTRYRFEAMYYLGRGDDGQAPIALSGGQFTQINVVSTFARVPGGVISLPKGTFDCRLGLLEALWDDSAVVHYGDLNPSYK